VRYEDGMSEGFSEAAIAAEFETGEREETVELARAHIATRLARMTLGTVVVILGVAMWFCPVLAFLLLPVGSSF